MTQNEEVIRYMEENGSISQREAVVELGIYRLSARIWDIKKRTGREIIGKRAPFVNRYGRRGNYTRYSFGG